MPKRQNDYSPGQYRTLLNIKALLVPFEPLLKVILDQKDSYYLAVPNKKKYRNLSGTMFAAIQIMDTTVDLFIGLLMINRKAFDPELIKGIEGLIDAKGVLHIHHLNNDLKETLKAIIEISLRKLPN